jgi:hypothetical protein
VAPTPEPQSGSFSQRSVAVFIHLGHSIATALVVVEQENVVLVGHDVRRDRKTWVATAQTIGTLARS